MTNAEWYAFNSKVRYSPDGCLVWTGTRIGGGYGHFRVRGQGLRLAHRLAYERFRGPIPTGMVCDHLCRNRACVNPFHLEVKTQRENIMAAGSRCISKMHAEQTRCHNGHPLSGENLYTYPTSRRRRCNECRRITARRRRQEERTCAA